MDGFGKWKAEGKDFVLESLDGKSMFRIYRKAGRLCLSYSDENNSAVICEGYHSLLGIKQAAKRYHTLLHNKGGGK